MKMFTKMMIFAVICMCISPLSARIKEYGNQTIDSTTTTISDVAADRYGYTYYLYKTTDAKTGDPILNLTIIKKTKSTEKVAVTDSSSAVVEKEAFSEERIVKAGKGVITLTHKDVNGETVIVQYRLQGKKGVVEIKKLDPVELGEGPTFYNKDKNFYTITGADSNILTIYKTKKLVVLATTKPFENSIKWMVEANAANKVIIIEDDGDTNTIFYIRSMQKLKEIGKKQYTTARAPFYHILGKDIMFTISLNDDDGEDYWQYDIFKLKTMKPIVEKIDSYEFGNFGTRYLLTRPNADTPTDVRTYKLYNW